MTTLAILCALLACVSLRLYLRNIRLVAKLRRARSRCAQLRTGLLEAERFGAAQLVRSFKRRAALVRIVRRFRRLRDDLGIADVVGAELAVGLHEQAQRYDAAIEALTRRVAELRPARETSASIAAWQNATFGPATTDPQRLMETRAIVVDTFEALSHVDLSVRRPNLSRAIRAAEELAELIRLLMVDDADPKAPREVADIDIVLRGIDAAHGVERADEVDSKMAINRKRRWSVTGDGHGQHVEEPPRDLSSSELLDIADAVERGEVTLP